MTQPGHRHRLILYTYMLDRWWRALLAIGLCLFVLAFGLGKLPGILSQYHFLHASDLELWVTAGTGGLVILAALLLILIRKAAYVQPLETHLHLVTPFLRMNIAYRRIKKVSCMDMKGLFPPGKITRWQRRLLYPLSRGTAIVLDLNGWPLPRSALHLFLSPFFFPDRTPRLALLIPNWMEFSTELDSHLGIWRASTRQPNRTTISDLYHSVIDPEQK